MCLMQTPSDRCQYEPPGLNRNANPVQIYNRPGSQGASHHQLCHQLILKTPSALWALIPPPKSIITLPTGLLDPNY